MSTVMDIVVAAIAGGAFTQLLNFVVTKPWRREKLDEADIMSRISTQLREELLHDNERKDEKIETLRVVIVNLTDLLDSVFPRIEGITAEEKMKLRAANLEARLAGLAA